MNLPQLYMDVLHIALGCPSPSAHLFERRTYETTEGSTWWRTCLRMIETGLLEQDPEDVRTFRVTPKGVKEYVRQRPQKRKH